METERKVLIISSCPHLAVTISLLAPDFGGNVDVRLARSFEDGAKKIRANDPNPAPEVILIDAFLRPAGSETPAGLAELLPEYTVPIGNLLVLEALKFRSTHIGLVVPPVGVNPQRRIHDIALGDNRYEFSVGMARATVNIQAPLVEYDPVTGRLIRLSNKTDFLTTNGDLAAGRLVQVIDWAEVFRTIVPRA